MAQAGATTSRFSILALGLSFLALPAAGRAESSRLSLLGTPAQLRRAEAWNRRWRASAEFSPWAPIRPFAEQEKSGYVAVSGIDVAELPDLRTALSRNLPPEVQLIIYVSDPRSVPKLKETYGPALGPRLKFLRVPDGLQLWARDALPFPVHLKEPVSPSGFGLVDSIYTNGFEPDAAFARAFSAPMISSQAQFRGGNLLMDLRGRCFAENTYEVLWLGAKAKAFLTQFFGCTEVTLLDQDGGIGDIDERLKFLADGSALTDSSRYARILKGKGYRVSMIPNPGPRYETYLNALLINGTVFVPQMGVPADADALRAYRAVGLNPVGVSTQLLADEGHGNIHCATMNYPDSAFIPDPENPDFVRFRSAD